MGRIKVLDPETVNLVAAGEVVERPASVVKELVENSFDAGATLVEVVVAGKELETITVADNGCGIAEEDLLLAFERYATSKISSRADLERIGTLGFRGEALPSIAAVSRVTLKTRVPGALGGSLVAVEGGRVVDFRPVGAPQGTTVTVRDLFYNTPARRKFLASGRTESAYLADAVTRLALARPDVSVRLVHSGREIFRTPGTGLAAAITVLYGETVAGALVPVRAEAGGMKVEGYVGQPALVRTTRRWQTLLVNGRYVKHAGLTAAVYEAYGTLLPSGKHPFFVLCLTLDPGTVDVNVHPQKLTVRFHREREVAGLVRGAVKQALFGQLSLIPGTFSSPVPPVQKVSPRPGWGSPALSCLSVGQRLGPFREVIGPGTDRTAGKETAGEPVGLDKTGFLVKEEAPAYREGFPPLTYLSFLPPCYLLASGPEGLYLVDLHAAHERVLFEEYGAALAGGGVAGQLLVEPVPVESGATDVSDLAEELARYGFVVEPFGEGMALLRAVPAGLDLERARLLLDDLLSCLAAGESPAQEEVVLASLACHSAVRAGEHPDAREAVALIKRLAACRQPFTCPHGRPTVVCFNWAELARRFGRR